MDTAVGDWTEFVVVAEDKAVETDVAVDSVVVAAVADTAAAVVVDTGPEEVHFEYTVGFVSVVADIEAAVIDQEYIVAAVVAVAGIAVEAVGIVPDCMAEAVAAVDTVAVALNIAVVPALLGTASADQNLGLEAFEMESVLDSGGVAIRQGTVCCRQNV